MEGVPVAWTPEHSDGQKYPFNCCASPDVREIIPNPEKSEEEVTECVNCGYDWSEAEP